MEYIWKYFPFLREERFAKIQQSTLKSVEQHRMGKRVKKCRGRLDSLKHNTFTGKIPRKNPTEQEADTTMKDKNVTQELMGR
jgi:hypothetical protein